ncbi:MAG TPA: DUF4340 domain-containing protein, partial [Longimicrobiales bacterium]|nr:DUF4340 domain-containing protein [Longimicrobiales bacterium]
MSERSLWLLTGALVLLLAIWGAVTLASSLGGGSPAGAGELARALEGLDQERVGRVVLAGPTDTVALERADGSWTANGFETDSAAVARLWTALSEVEVGDLAAANPANHARLGVTADSAWSLGFHSGEGEELARILLGNRGPGMASAYARLPDDDEVFLLEGGLRGAAARETDHWRDKVIVQVDTSRVQRIDVSREGEAYALTRGDDGWTV